MSILLLFFYKYSGGIPMRLRPPAVPLITVDPYFSIWSPADKLTERTAVHWTGKENRIDGFVTVDGETLRFLDCSHGTPMPQTKFDMNALVTSYEFENGKIRLCLDFYTPFFIDDLYRLSRPVSYLKIGYKTLDGAKHDVSVRIAASEQLCLDKAGQYEVETEIISIADGVSAIKMGSKVQNYLNREGDDLRIDWGYFYLTAPKGAKLSTYTEDEMTFVGAEFDMECCKKYDVLFAYDDIYSIEYFKKPLKAYWHTKGISIEEAIAEALAESDEMLEKCRTFSAKLYDDAKRVGGEKYAELLELAYRQVIAAHKIVTDENGDILFISKECFSNGCAATVDVTYPSAPLFLLYNTELLKGMLRPIFKYAVSDEWVFDFAPHDVGTYPLVNGQRYGWKSKTLEEYRTKQMPVEECGNMIILMANIAMLDGNMDFAAQYMPILEQWVNYLVEFGADPENQLCTDDFAGHLAHNCNLSLKAIMGIQGYSIMLKMQGDNDGAEKFAAIAKDMADSWSERAYNGDGSFRLAFDKPDTFSMKYNIIWDKIWGTKLFKDYLITSEFFSNLKHINYYGMPLDSRKAYTKSDWLVWTACLAPTQDDFEKFITPLWDAYNVTCSRVPMTDWYDTNTAQMVGFRHRTVQGGLFIKLLEEKFKTL